MNVQKKQKVVLVGGVFDIIHPGHIFFLEKAKEQADRLVVVVARDSTVKRLKKAPIIPESQRLEVVSALKPVDFALLGKEEDITEIVKEIKPDIIVLGPDQSHDLAMLKKKLQKLGMKTELTRLIRFKENELCSTKNIIKKIKESRAH